MKTLKQVLAGIRGVLLVLLLVLTAMFSIFYPTGFYYARYFLIITSIVTIIAWLGELTINFVLPSEMGEEETSDDFYEELDKCNTREDYVNMYIRARKEHDKIKMKQVVFSYKNFERASKEAENAFDEEDDETEGTIEAVMGVSTKSTSEDFSDEDYENLLEKYSPERVQETLPEKKEVEEKSPLEEKIVLNLAQDNAAKEGISLNLGQNEAAEDKLDIQFEDDDVEDDDDEDDDEIISLRRLIDASRKIAESES